MPAKPAKVSWDVTDGLTGGPTAIGSPREAAGMVLAGNEGNSLTRITCLQKKKFLLPQDFFDPVYDRIVPSTHWGKKSTTYRKYTRDYHI